MDPEAKGERRLFRDLGDALMGRIPHPCGLRAGLDFVALGGQVAAEQVEARRRAMDEQRELAWDRTVRRQPEDLLTDLQIKILKLLEVYGPLTADGLAEKSLEFFRDNGWFSRRALFHKGGIRELMEADPPRVLKGRKGSGYHLAWVTPDPSESRLH